MKQPKPKKINNPGLVTRVSVHLGVPENLVAEIAHAQSEFTAEMIRSGKLEGVMWPYIGKIHIPPKKIQNGTQNLGLIKQKATQYPKQNTEK